MSSEPSHWMVFWPVGHACAELCWGTRRRRRAPAQHCTGMANWPNTIQCLGSDDIMSLGIKSSATEVLGSWSLVRCYLLLIVLLFVANCVAICCYLLLIVAICCYLSLNVTICCYLSFRGKGWDRYTPSRTRFSNGLAHNRSNVSVKNSQIGFVVINFSRSIFPYMSNIYENG